MSVLNSHIGVEIAGVGLDSAFANAGEVIPLDQNDRWDEFPNAVKITAAPSPRTKDLEWISSKEKVLRHHGDLLKCKNLFRQDLGREASPTDSEVPVNA